MQHFAHDSIDFHYYDAGSGAAVVFQHGLGSDASSLVGLFQPPLGFRLLSMDFRAHGGTQPLGPLKKISMAAFAEDLLAFLDERRIEQAVVGGISMGAAVAVNFAMRFPHRVEALILARPCWLDSPLPPNARVFVSIARCLQHYGAKKGREEFSESEEYRELFRQWPRFAPSLLGLFDGARAEETALTLERIANDAPCRSLDELAAIHAATLVLANRNDPVHPFEYGETLARAIPGARLYEITAKSESECRYAADVQRSITEFVMTVFGSPS